MDTNMDMDMDMDPNFLATIGEQIRDLNVEVEELQLELPCLNNVIQRIEEGLAHLGIGGWLYEDPEDAIDRAVYGNEEESGWMLGFDRYKGEWRLVAQRFDSADRNKTPAEQLRLLHAATVPLAEAPPNVRLAALDRVPEFIAALRERVIDLYANIRYADESIRSVAGASAVPPESVATANTRMVTISRKNLVARVNRRLATRGEFLRSARSQSDGVSYLYCVLANDRDVVKHKVTDLRTLATELGVVRMYEQLAE